MSLKSQEGKSLKGNKPSGSGGSIDMKALLAALSQVGLTLTNVTLQNAIIWSGQMDDVAIGMLLPSSGNFTKVQIGLPGNGGSFLLYGDKSPDLTYDDDGNIISMTGGDFMTWEPTPAILNIQGGLSVRDPSRLGNIIIRDNQIVAIAPKDGDIEIIPESEYGHVHIGGNISQNASGVVKFDYAKEFSTNSDTTTSINARGNTFLTTEKGDITISTDVKSLTEISKIVHHESTTKDEVSSDIYGVVTQVQSTQSIVGDEYEYFKETTTVDRLIRLIREIKRTKINVSGKPALEVDTTITVYDPETDSLKSENSVEVIQGPVVFERLKNGITTHKAIVHTVTDHGIIKNDVITINGTNSIPSYDGVFTVENVISRKEFELPSDDKFSKATTGRIIVPETGSIHLSASQKIRLDIAVPLVFGEDSLSHKPQIEATTQDNLELYAKNIRLKDPIITIHSKESENSNLGTGIALSTSNNGLNVQGFLGSLYKDQTLTWIPNALITLNDDGTKSVQGEKGLMDVKGIRVQDIIGNPDINLNTPEGSINFESKMPITISPSLNIGKSGSIGQENGNVVLRSFKDIELIPTRNVNIPEGKSLTFSDSTSITGDINGGLNIVSSMGTTSINSDVSIPAEKLVSIGGGTLHSTATDLNISSAGSLNLNPATVVKIPDNTFLQMGDIPNNGLVSSNGSLNVRSIANIETISGGNYVQNSGGSMSLNVGSGVLNLNSTQVSMPSKSELTFSKDNVISTLHGNGLSISSSDSVVLDTPYLNLNATTSAHIPENIPLIFGDASKIYSSDTGVKKGLHITDPDGVYVDKNLTVTGAFTVYGPVTEITSVHTNLQDPIITLGYGDAIETIKDRGVQFQYGDGKLGFMGFSQQDSRFYLIKEGFNNDEIFTKDNLGDLSVGSVHADVIFSQNGFGSKVIRGDPYLTIDSSYINLNVSDYINIPFDRSLQFGDDRNTITGTLESLKISSPSVDFINGVITLGNSNISYKDNVLTFSGITKTEFSSVVNITDTLTLGNDASLTYDEGNLTLTSSNEILLEKKTRFSDEGLIIGNGILHKRLDTDILTLENNLDSSPLDLSIKGNIIDAQWFGQTISTAYGGTGKVGSWHAQSVVFVDNDWLSLTEDPTSFVYDRLLKRLAIGTKSFTNTLTLGKGGIDILTENSSINFLSTESRFHNWKIETTSNNDVFSISGSSSSLDETLSFSPSLMINKHGQLALGKNVDMFFNSLNGTERTVVSIGDGDVRFIYPHSSLVWNDCTFIRSNLQYGLEISSCTVLSLHANAHIKIVADGDFSVNSTTSLIECDNVYRMDVGKYELNTTNDSITINSFSSLDITANSGIQITTDQNAKIVSKSSLLLNGKQSINLTTEGTLTFSSGGALSFESGTSDMTIKTGGGFSVASGSYIELKADNSNIDMSGLDVILYAKRDILGKAERNLEIDVLNDLDITCGGNGKIYSERLLNIVCSDDMVVESLNGNLKMLADVGNIDIVGNYGINLSTANVDGDITFSSSRDVILFASRRATLHAVSDFELQSNQNFKLSSDGDGFLMSQQNLSVSSGGKLTLTSQAGYELANVGDLVMKTEGTILTIATVDYVTNANNIYQNAAMGLTCITGRYSLESSITSTLTSFGNIEISSALDTLIKSDTNVNIECKQSINSICNIYNVQCSQYSITASDSISYTSQNSLNLTAHGDINLLTLGMSVLNLTSENDIEVVANESLKITSKNFTVSSTNVGIEASNDITFKSQSSMSIESVMLDLHGNIMNMRASDTYTLSASKSLVMTSDEILTITSIGNLNVNSDSDIFLKTQSSLHLESLMNVSITSYNDWIVESKKSIIINSYDDILLNSNTSDVTISGSTLNFSSKNDINLISTGKTHIESELDLSFRSLADILLSCDGSFHVNTERSIYMDTQGTLTLNSDENLSITTMFGSFTSSIEQDILFSSRMGHMTFRTETGSMLITSANTLDMSSTTLMSLTAETQKLSSTSGTTIISNSNVTLQSTSGKIIMNGSQGITMESPVHLSSYMSIVEDSTIFSAKPGGYVELTSTYITVLSSKHVLIPNRLCLFHDDGDVCRIYQERSNDNNLDIVNEVGDITLSPKEQVVLKGSSSLYFENIGSITPTGSRIEISTKTGDIDIRPGSQVINVPLDTSLKFGETTSITQNVNSFVITNSSAIDLDSPVVSLPDNSALVFGDYTRRIESDGDTLFIHSKDLLSLESDTVRITGNLIVSKRSTFTIESETVFDSGVITVGGGNRRDIIDLQPFEDDTINTTNTLVTLSEEHGLRIGDSITLIDTNPNIDGTFQVVDIPDPRTFRINREFPNQIYEGPIGGSVRYAFTIDPGFDEGIQFNWHNGKSNDTSSARTGFFGFDRSTERLTFIPEASRTGLTYSGIPGDFQIGDVYSTGLHVPKLLSSLDTNDHLVHGNNFVINGGSLDGTPIGNKQPSTGIFTDVTTDNLIVNGGDVVENLNADLLDGYHADAFILRDGSTPLTFDWNAGNYRISTAGISDTTLSSDSIVTVGTFGKLQTDDRIKFIDGNLQVPSISGFSLTGDIDLNGFSVRNGTIVDSGIIDSSFTNGNITGTLLTGTDIVTSTFNEGEVKSSVMISSQIKSSNFDQGTISTSNVKNVTIDTSDIMESTFVRGTIDDTEMKNSIINTSTVSSTNISLSSYTNGSISESVLTKNLIQDNDLLDNRISGGTVTNVNISDSTIENSEMRNTNIDNGTVTNTTMTNGTITESTFSNGTIDNVSIHEANISLSNIDRSTFSTGTLQHSMANNMVIDLSEYTNGTMESSTIGNSVMNTSVINDSKINNTDIVDSRLSTSSLSESTIVKSKVSESTIVGSAITETTFTNGSLSTSVLDNVEINQSTANQLEITNSNLHTGTITDYVLESSQFNNGSIMMSSFTQGTITLTDMLSSKFVNGNLESSIGNDLSISNSNISTTFITESNYENGNIKNTVFTNGTITTSNLTENAISNSTFTTGNITDSTIQNVSQSESEITTTKIFNSSFNEGTLSKNVIYTSEFNDGLVQTSEISNSTMRNSTFNDNSHYTSTLHSSQFISGDISISNISNSKIDQSDITNSFFKDGVLTTSVFRDGDIHNTNIYMEKDKVFDASRGTIVFANDQIHGEWVKGGTSDVDISGNAETVTDGVYRRDFAEDHSILKADESGEPYSLHIPKETLVGRRQDNISALTVEDVQDMLDIVQKKWFKNNSILKADVEKTPVALEIPDHTIVGRFPGDVISALTAEQVIQMIMSTEVLHRYGALLRDGHRTFPDGGQMTGLLYYSTERFSLTTGQKKELDLNVETSYVSLNFSKGGGRLAELTLGRGFADGHRKVIILSQIAQHALLQVYCDFVAPDVIDPYVFVFNEAGQSAHLQWDTVLSKWLIVGSGCHALTRDDMRDPDWINNLGIDD